MKNLYKKILILAAAFGPGLFLVGYNIGTGSVTTMASAGASHGMMLTWAVFLSCLFTYFLIVVFSRFTLVTGETVLYSFKKHIGKGAAYFVLATLIISEMISSIGVMAVLSEVTNEWTKPITSSGAGIGMFPIAIFFAVLLVYFLFTGYYTKIEVILAVLVGIMGTCFVLTTFMVIPDAGAVIKGLMPNIPDDNNAGLVVAGMIGTTMGGILFITRSATIKQKGWTIEDSAAEKKDALLSISLMFILSISIMAAAAGTLYPLGIHVENAVDMVKTLEPLAGRFAITIFVTGIIAAGLSSLFPHYMLVPLLLSDYNQEKLDLNKWRNRGIVLFYAALGMFVPIFGGRPVSIMIMSQALALIATPLILIFMQYLLNKEELMGEHKISLATNIGISLITLFTVYMAYVGAIGIIETL